MYAEKLQALAKQTEREKAAAIARNLVADRIDMAVIERATGLTRQEIQALQPQDPSSAAT